MDKYGVCGAVKKTPVKELTFIPEQIIISRLRSSNEKKWGFIHLPVWGQNFRHYSVVVQC